MDEEAMDEAIYEAMDPLETLESNDPAENSVDVIDDAEDDADSLPVAPRLRQASRSSMRQRCRELSCHGDGLTGLHVPA